MERQKEKGRKEEREKKRKALWRMTGQSRCRCVQSLVGLAPVPVGGRASFCTAEGLRPGDGEGASLPEVRRSVIHTRISTEVMVFKEK